jgi:nicotinamide-nucleotide amidase
MPRRCGLPASGATLIDKSVIIICVSREILEGTVVDRNAAFMANRIDDLGYRVRTIEVVDRVEAEMVAALKWALEQKPGFVLMSGGMGPNWDDNSRSCAAKATGLALRQDKIGLECVRSAYQRMYAKGLVDDPALTEARAGMAMVPEGSICHENPIGTAPAVQLKSGSTTIFLLPGVPAELQRIFTLYVLPAMSAEGPTTVRRERQIDYHGHDESAISRLLGELAGRYPNVSLRTRVQGTEEAVTIRITLVAEHSDPVALDELLERAEADLRKRLGVEVFGRPTDASREGD